MTDLVDLIFSDLDNKNIYSFYKSAVKKIDNSSNQDFPIISYNELIENINSIIENDLNFEDFLNASTEDVQNTSIFSNYPADLRYTLKLLSSLPSYKLTRYV